MILQNSQSFAEALEVNDFPLSQVADGITYLRVSYHPQDIVIGGAGFLLCCNCERTTYHVKQIGQAAFIHAKTEY